MTMRHVIIMLTAGTLAVTASVALGTDYGLLLAAPIGLIVGAVGFRLFG